MIGGNKTCPDRMVSEHTGSYILPKFLSIVKPTA